MKRLAMRSESAATLVRVWPFLKPEGWRLLYVVATTLGLTAVEVSVPILVGLFVDSLLAMLNGQEPGTSLSNQLIIGLLVAGALLLGLMAFLQRASSGRIGQRMAGRMRDALWTHLQKLPLEYSRRRGAGRLPVRFISDARAVQWLVARGIVQPAQDVLVVAGVLAVLVFINLYAGLAVALVVPVVAAIFWYLKRVNKLNRNVVKHGSRRETVGGLLLGASAGAVALITVLGLGMAAREVAAGRLTVGQLVAFLALVGLLAPVFRRITITDRTLQEAQISVQRLSETLATRPESPRDSELATLDVSEGVVSVEEVSFAYPDGTVALEDVSLTARRGELVAVVGPNGAGKSTLLELVPRFREPTGGRILIDGQDLAGVSLGSLRSRVGLVTQDAPLFDGTIAENVVCEAWDEATEERVQRAARLAGVDELVASLADGWETRVREGHRELSHGQRQRIALARALVANPPVILLDQAASAMDEESLWAFAQRVRELARDKTVIIATHRLSGLLVADRVYALEHGQALEVSASALRARYESGCTDDAGTRSDTPGEATAGRWPETRHTARNETKFVNRKPTEEEEE